MEGTSAWNGTDAEQFRANWSNSSKPLIARSVEFLKDAANALNLHADEQETASAAEGVGSSGETSFVGEALRMAQKLAAALAQAPSAGGSEPVEVPSGMTAQETSEWWNQLTPAQRRDLIENHPELVGNLDGLPGSARDEANRLLLVSERDRLDAELKDATGERRAQIQESLKALDSIEASLKDGEKQLLLLDVDNGGHPKAAIAVGNVDTADHVAVITPGISTSVSGDMEKYTTNAHNLNKTSDEVNLLAGKDETVATVAWLGYEFPPGADNLDSVGEAMKIATPTTAMDGGRRLAAFGEGLKASHGDGDLHLTALGHSYGSTTTGYAVQYTSAFDSVAFFGSPGIGTSGIDNLKVPPGQTFVLEARGDFVADIGVFGGDPNHLWGVNELSTSKSGHLNAATGHSEYLNQKTTSQWNMAAVLTGNDNIAIHGGNNGFGDLAGGIAGVNHRIASGLAEGVNKGLTSGVSGIIEEVGRGNYGGAYVNGVRGITEATVEGLKGGVQGISDTVDAVVDGSIGVLKDVGDSLSEGWNNLFK